MKITSPAKAIQDDARDLTALRQFKDARAHHIYKGLQAGMLWLYPWHFLGAGGRDKKQVWFDLKNFAAGAFKRLIVAQEA